MITDTINQIKSMVNQFGSTGDMPSAVCQALDNNLDNIQSIYEFGKPNVITQHLTRQNE